MSALVYCKGEEAPPPTLEPIRGHSLGANKTGNLIFITPLFKFQQLCWEMGYMERAYMDTMKKHGLLNTVYSFKTLVFFSLKWVQTFSTLSN